MKKVQKGMPEWEIPEKYKELPSKVKAQLTVNNLLIQYKHLLKAEGADETVSDKESEESGSPKVSINKDGNNTMMIDTTNQQAT